MKLKTTSVLNRTILVLFLTFSFTLTALTPVLLPLQWWCSPANNLDAFVICGTTDITAPVLVQQVSTGMLGNVVTSTVPGWPTILTVPVTNTLDSTGTNFGAYVAMVPQSLFLTVFGSNSWGYSSNSNVLNVKGLAGMGGLKTVKQ